MCLPFAVCPAPCLPRVGFGMYGLGGNIKLSNNFIYEKTAFIK